jgi:hypothetical protein
MDSQVIKTQFSNTTQTIIKVAAVIGAITVIVSGYAFYVNNFYIPNVLIIETDFPNGKAIVKYRGKELKLEGDAIFLISGEWGIRLGGNRLNDKYFFDRIELLKKGMVYQVLK